VKWKCTTVVSTGGEVQLSVSPRAAPRREPARRSSEGEGGFGEPSVGLSAALLVQVELLHLLLQEAGGGHGGSPGPAVRQAVRLHGDTTAAA